MVFKKFTIEVVIRTILLLLTLMGLAWLISDGAKLITSVIVGAVSILQVWWLIKVVDRTNTELARFLNAIRYNDFQQSFSIEHLGSSFGELNAAFDDIIKKFRDARTEKETQARYLQIMLEHIPVSVVSLHNDGRVELLNNAARKLFNVPDVDDMEGFHIFGPRFQRDMNQAQTGQTRLTQLEQDGETENLIMSTTELVVGGDAQRLVTLQNIQSELDATELTAWQDLVRVLSHEIMNSITPISSLARTSSELVADLAKDVEAGNPHKPEDYQDIKDAVDTVARRSEGLMHFVKSYRKLTQMPPPKTQKVAFKDYFPRMENLMRAEWKGRGISLHVDLQDPQLVIVADEEQLDQAVINLLQNAADAVAEQSKGSTTGAIAGQVILTGRLSERGKAVIEISDNGKGIDPEKAEQIFLPFFTTKTEGSGIGLALVRQIMLVHKGSVFAGKSEAGGALFRLTF